jgi:hypothetical protein
VRSWQDYARKRARCIVPLHGKRPASLGAAICSSLQFAIATRGCSYFARRIFQRSQDSVRAFLSASLASGASPARIKPWPAPS